MWRRLVNGILGSLVAISMFTWQNNIKRQVPSPLCYGRKTIPSSNKDVATKHGDILVASTFLRSIAFPDFRYFAIKSVYNKINISSAYLPVKIPSRAPPRKTSRLNVPIPHSARQSERFGAV